MFDLDFQNQSLRSGNIYIYFSFFEIPYFGNIEIHTKKKYALCIQPMLRIKGQTKICLTLIFTWVIVVRIIQWPMRVIPTFHDIFRYLLFFVVISLSTNATEDIIYCLLPMHTF